MAPPSGQPPVYKCATARYWRFYETKVVTDARMAADTAAGWRFMGADIEQVSTHTWSP